MEDRKLKRPCTHDKGKVAELITLNMCGHDAASKRHKICRMRAIFAKLFLVYNINLLEKRILHHISLVPAFLSYSVHRSCPLYIQVNSKLFGFD